MRDADVWDEGRAAEGAHRRMLQKKFDDQLAAKISGLTAAGKDQATIDRESEEMRKQHVTMMQQSLAEFRVANEHGGNTGTQKAEMQVCFFTPTNIKIKY